MRFRLPEIPPPKLISALRSFNLLPAIIFLPSRRKCDEAASEVAADKSQKLDLEKQARRQQIFDEFVAAFPEIKTHKHRKIMLRGGVAAHHAGHIPAWKLLIEKMMSEGLLNAIFATSTVAAGVDFPARTVVILNADARGNDGWRPLQASELQQMTGRAGRRGKDNVGFVVLAPGQFQNPKKIAELLKSPSDPLESKFRATYSSLLNLLDAFGTFGQVREIAEKSFAFRETARKIKKLENKRANRRRDLQIKLSGNEFGLTEPDVFGFQRLTAARGRLEQNLPVTRDELRHSWLAENVTGGRIVTKGKSGKRFFLVLNVFGEKVSVMREDGHGATLPLAQIGRVYPQNYRLEAASFDKFFDDLDAGEIAPLREQKLAAGKTANDEAIEIVSQLIEKFFPANLPKEKRDQAETILWEAWDDAEFLEKSARDREILGNEIWLPFEHRARVLDHFGYLDFAAQKVTETGKWLADVRVDRPVLIGEVLKHGIFEKLAVKNCAGLMAALAADSERDYGELHLSDELLETLGEIENIVFEVSSAEWKFGVPPSDEINFSAAAAAENWANGMNWDELVFRTKAEEGDLVRLLSRTGEALKQIAQLRDSNPQAATIARQTAEIILREPIR